MNFKQELSNKGTGLTVFEFLKSIGYKNLPSKSEKCYIKKHKNNNSSIVLTVIFDFCDNTVLISEDNVCSDLISNNHIYHSNLFINEMYLNDVKKFAAWCDTNLDVSDYEVRNDN